MKFIKALNYADGVTDGAHGTFRQEGVNSTEYKRGLKEGHKIYIKIQNIKQGEMKQISWELKK